MASKKDKAIKYIYKSTVVFGTFAMAFLLATIISSFLNLSQDIILAWVTAILLILFVSSALLGIYLLRKDD